MRQAAPLVCLAVLWAALSIRAEEPGPGQGGATMSPQMRAVLKATLPNQGTFVPAPPKPATELVSFHPETDTSIIRLPKYIVNEARTPTAKEATSPQGLAAMAMDKYLGSKDGLDRGFLNHFTLGQIPLVGGIFEMFGLSIRNEDRAMQRYYEDERLRRMTELLDLSSVTTKTGDPTLGEKIRRETEKTFMRK